MDNIELNAQKKVTVVVPSYQPDEKLERVVCGLEEAGFDDIIVVDDGSSPDKKAFFPKKEEHPAMTLLVHPQNRGKGAALRTAFAWFHENRPDRVGVVTADGDAQHRTRDILACSERLIKEKNKLVLGVRDFTLPHVPKRSKTGNYITIFAFRVFCGLKISDTQTGLRAIPAEFIPDMLEVKGDRYEYEANMLLEMKGMGLDFCEEPIETVYIEENQTSHFRPFRDSVRIYSLILKFLASSIISNLVDLLAFYLLSKFLGPHLPSIANEFVCTAIARVISACCNFILNKKVVFRNKASVGAALLKYAALAVPVMLVSAGCVKLLKILFNTTMPIISTLLKMVVDTVLYFVNFRIQRAWVFAEKKKHD